MKLIISTLAPFLIQLVFLTLNAAAIDTSLIPQLTDHQKLSVVGIRCTSSSGSGFVINSQQSGTGFIHFALTAEHVTDDEISHIELSNGLEIYDVNVVHSKISEDLSLVRFRSAERLPVLTLAPAGYPMAIDAPVMALGKATDRVLEHIGTFRTAGSDIVTEASGQYVQVACYTPPGFSGGPYVVVDPHTRNLRVIGVIARSDVTSSYGPSISEVHRFLNELGDGNPLVQQNAQLNNPLDLLAKLKQSEASCPNEVCPEPDSFHQIIVWEDDGWLEEDSGDWNEDSFDRKMQELEQHIASLQRHTRMMRRNLILQQLPPQTDPLHRGRIYLHQAKLKYPHAYESNRMGQKIILFEGVIPALH